MRLRIDPTSPSGLSPIQTDTIISTTVAGGGGTGIVESIVAGANVTVDSTDPKNPIVSASGEGGTTDHAALSHLTYADSGHTGFAPALGGDDNYVTDTEKTNLHAPMSDNQVADGVTITGVGTVMDPFVAVTGGAGDVVGPTGAVDSNFAAFDTNTGKLIKDSGYNSSSFAATLGEDDNYVTDAEKLALHTAVTVTGEDYLTLSTQAITTNPIDLDNLSATGTPSSNNYLRGDNTWSEISAGSGGYAANLYFTTIDSDVSGYKKISYVHEATETILTATVKNQELLIRSYLYDAVIGTTVIDSGKWVANYYAKVSSTSGTTSLNLEPFVRHADNSETTLFKVDGMDINSTDYILISTDSIQPAFDILSTDRLGIRIYAETSSNANITINTKVGDGSASHFTTPLAIRHTQLRGLNDDTNNVHVTSTEKTAITHSNRTVLDNTTASFTTTDESKLDGLIQYTNEMAQDAIGNAIGNGLDYDDSSGAISVDETELVSLMPKSGGTFTNDITMSTGKSVAFNNGTNDSTLYLYNDGSTGNSVLTTDSNIIANNIASGTTVSGSNTGDQTTITGSAGSLKSPATTGLARLTGMGTGTTRDYTVPDANATLLYSGSALGTPASGTVTNLTGTASININGTVGATTPTTVVGTTITANTSVSTDIIIEKTTDTGITIDGVKLKDNLIVGGSGTGVSNTSLDTTAGSIGGAWLAWTPTLSGLFADAKWNKTCVYTKIGKTVIFRLVLVANTTTPMSGSGTATFTLPVTSTAIPSTNTPMVLGNALLDDSGTSIFSGFAQHISTTTGRIRQSIISGSLLATTNPTSSTPFTWTTNDEIVVQGTYEAE